MAAAAVSDFVRRDSSRQSCVRALSFSLHAKCCANKWSNNRFIDEKLNFKMAATAILDFVKNMKLFSRRQF